MTGPDFTTALTTLGLDNHQAAQWLGVSVKSVRRYRVSGVKGPVAGMVRLALRLQSEEDKHVRTAQRWAAIVHVANDLLNLLSVHKNFPEGSYGRERVERAESVLAAWTRDDD